MSSLPPASRPVLGALALVSALVLTACAGEEPGGAPAGPGPVSSAAPAEPGPDSSTGNDAGGATEPAGGRSGAAEDPAEEPAGTEGTADGSAAGSTADERRAAGTRTGGGSALCTTSQLEVAAAPVGGAAGSVHVDVVVTNAGEAPCTLAGYAGVSFVDAAGAMIGSPAVRDATAPGTGRVVAPGESVSAGLRVSQAGNHPACDARTAAGLRVYPPENTESVVVRFPVEACGDPRIHQLEIQGFGT